MPQELPSKDYLAAVVDVGERNALDGISYEIITIKLWKSEKLVIVSFKGTESGTYFGRESSLITMEIQIPSYISIKYEHNSQCFGKFKYNPQYQYYELLNSHKENLYIRVPPSSMCQTETFLKIQ